MPEQLENKWRSLGSIYNEIGNPRTKIGGVESSRWSDHYFEHHFPIFVFSARKELKRVCGILEGEAMGDKLFDVL